MLSPSSTVLSLYLFFFLMIRRPPRSTLSSSSAASDVYKRQYQRRVRDRLALMGCVTRRPSGPLLGLRVWLRLALIAVACTHCSGMGTGAEEGVVAFWDDDLATLLDVGQPPEEVPAEPEEVPVEGEDKQAAHDKAALAQAEEQKALNARRSALEADAQASLEVKKAELEKAHATALALKSAELESAHALHHSSELSQSVADAKVQVAEDESRLSQMKEKLGSYQADVKIRTAELEDKKEALVTAQQRQSTVGRLLEQGQFAAAEATKKARLAHAAAATASAKSIAADQAYQVAHDKANAVVEVDKGAETRLTQATLDTKQAEQERAQAKEAFAEAGGAFKKSLAARDAAEKEHQSAQTSLQAEGLKLAAARKAAAEAEAEVEKRAGLFKVSEVGVDSAGSMKSRIRSIVEAQHNVMEGEINHNRRALDLVKSRLTEAEARFQQMGDRERRAKEKADAARDDATAAQEASEAAAARLRASEESLETAVKREAALRRRIEADTASLKETIAKLSAGKTEVELLREAFGRQTREQQQARAQKVQQVTGLREGVGVRAGSAKRAEQALKELQTGLARNADQQAKLKVSEQAASEKETTAKQGYQHAEAAEAKLEHALKNVETDEHQAASASETAHLTLEQSQLRAQGLGEAVAQAAMVSEPLHAQLQKDGQTLETNKETEAEAKAQALKSEAVLAQRIAEEKKDRKATDESSDVLKGTKKREAIAALALSRANGVVELRQKEEGAAAAELAQAHQDSAALTASATAADARVERMETKATKSEQALELARTVLGQAQHQLSLKRHALGSAANATERAKDSRRDARNALDTAQTLEWKTSEMVGPATADAATKTGELAAVTAAYEAAVSGLQFSRTNLPLAAKRAKLETQREGKLKVAAEAAVHALKREEDAVPELQHLLRQTQEGLQTAAKQHNATQHKLNGLKQALSLASTEAAEKARAKEEAAKELQQVQDEVRPLVIEAQRTTKALADSKDDKMAADAEHDRLTAAARKAQEAKEKAHSLMLQAREEASDAQKFANAQMIAVAEAKAALVTAAATQQAKQVKQKAAEAAAVAEEEAAKALKRSQLTVAERGSKAEQFVAQQSAEEKSVKAEAEEQPDESAEAIAAKHAVELAEKRMSELAASSIDATEKARTTGTAFLQAQDKFFHVRSLLEEAKISADRATRAQTAAEAAAKKAAEVAQEAQKTLAKPEEALATATEAADAAEERRVAASEPVVAMEPVLQDAQRMLDKSKAKTAVAKGTLQVQQNAVKEAKLNADTGVKAARTAEEAAAMAVAEEARLRTEITEQTQQEGLTQKQQTTLEAEAASAKSHLSNLQGELKETTDRIQRLVPKVEEASKKLSVARGEKAEATDAEAAAKGARLNADAEVQGASDRVKMLTKVVQGANVQSERLHGEASKAKELIRERETQDKAALEAVKDAQLDAKPLKPQLLKAKDAVVAAEEQHDNRESALVASESVVAKASAHEAEQARAFDAAQAKVGEAQEALVVLKAQAEASAKAVSTNTDRKKDADLALVQAHSSTEKAKERHSELTDAVKQSAGQLDAAQTVASQASEQLARSQQDVAQLDAELRGLRLEAGAFQGQQTSEELAQKESTAELQSAKGTLVAAEQQLKKLKINNKLASERTEGSISGLEKQNSGYEQQIQQLEQQLKSLQSEHRQAEQTVTKDTQAREKAENQVHESVVQIEPTEIEAVRAAQAYAMHKETAELTKENVQYQEGRLGDLGQEEEGLEAQHSQLRADLNQQLALISNTSKEEIVKLEKQTTALAKARAAAREARATAAAAAAEHSTAAKLVSQSKLELSESRKRKLIDEEMKANATVVLEDESKGLELKRSDLNQAKRAFDQARGVTANDEQRQIETKVDKEKAGLASKHASDAADQAKNAKDKADTALSKIESDQQVAAQALMQANLQRNTAETELSKASTKKELVAEQIAALSQQLSDLRIRSSGNEEAHRVATATAHALVGKAEKLARQSVTRTRVEDTEEAEEEEEAEDAAEPVA
eukprot:TRINITY_DN6846_c0_g1_i1.p1 TRINITY_DN6846_c0_g1~~TRINITY_DN6846_c0_g1_i1.p1  ORF type:complete len:2023 (-),score=801.54 TRINITY_DN6846_c0_g1_i1:246-6314(-)